MPEARPTPPSTASKKTVLLRRLSSTVFLWGLVSAVFISMQAWAFLALISALVLIASIEYNSMLKSSNIRTFSRFSIASTVVYLATLSYYFLIGYSELPTGLDTIFIACIAIGVFTMQMRHAVHQLNALNAITTTLLGYIYIPFLFGFVAKIVFLLATSDSIKPGAFMLIWLLAVTKFSDMGAYIVGSMIGKHKMIPHISPAKTWEGFGGAILFSQLAGVGLYLLLPEYFHVFTNIWHVLVVSFVLSILAVIGDLAESVLKRSFGAKDSGNFLPGIGGSLDLIDSICFTAPVLFFYLKWVIQA